MHSRTQPGLGDEEGYGYPDVHGHRAVRERARLASLPFHGGSPLHVSLFTPGPAAISR